MATPQWVKKLGGHAGELYVAAELSKRSIPNALWPENFSDDDVIAGGMDGPRLCFIRVKAYHPHPLGSFIHRESHERWQEARDVRIPGPSSASLRPGAQQGQGSGYEGEAARTRA